MNADAKQGWAAVEDISLKWYTISYSVCLETQKVLCLNSKNKMTVENFCSSFDNQPFAQKVTKKQEKGRGVGGSRIVFTKTREVKLVKSTPQNINIIFIVLLVVLWYQYMYLYVVITSFTLTTFMFEQVVTM